MGEQVVWQKSGPKGKAAKSSVEVNAARRSGTQVETEKKINAGGNQSAHSVVPNAKKLDENMEAFRHETVSHDFKLALQQARLAKKISQSALGTAINEKGTVINEYESGKAIPNGAIINKLNRSLGVRLPKAFAPRQAVLWPEVRRACACPRVRRAGCSFWLLVSFHVRGLAVSKQVPGACTVAPDDASPIGTAVSEI